MAQNPIRQWFAGKGVAEDEAAAAARSRVLGEQTGLLVRQSRTGLINALITGSLLALIMGRNAGWAPVVAWLAVLAAGMVLRQRLLLRAHAAGDLQQVLRIAVWGAAALGFIITLPCLLYFPQAEYGERSLLTMIHLVWMTVAVSILGVYPPSYRVYAGVCLINIAAGWLRADGDRLTAVLLCVGFVPMWLVLNGFATRLGQLVADSINIRHEREQLVQKLEVSLAETEAAQRARSRFLASASHDLLQPVHALLLLSGLTRDLPEGPQREGALQQLHGTAESIDAMFRGLLDLARFDAGTLQPQLTAMPVAHVLRSVQAAYQPRCAEKDVVLTMEIPPALQVHADPVLFERVARNLVDNAVKFTPRGEIAVRCRREGELVFIEVHDSGVGIAEEDLAHVQEAFYRGASAREVEAVGVGLGLANATEMARLMHGDLTLSSRKGEGTVATLVLPAATAAEERPAGAGLRHELRLRAIVLVEDDRTAREATVMWLREHGAKVAAGVDLASTLAAIEQQAMKPEFLLVDYRLGPGLNGTQVVAALRERFGPLPAAIISGEPLSLADLPPGTPLLPKPLRPEKLVQLLI